MNLIIKYQWGDIILNSKSIFVKNINEHFFPKCKNVASAFKESKLHLRTNLILPETVPNRIPPCLRFLFIHKQGLGWFLHETKHAFNHLEIFAWGRERRH